MKRQDEGTGFAVGVAIGFASLLAAGAPMFAYRWMTGTLSFWPPTEIFPCPAVFFSLALVIGHYLSKPYLKPEDTGYDHEFEQANARLSGLAWTLGLCFAAVFPPFRNIHTLCFLLALVLVPMAISYLLKWVEVIASHKIRRRLKIRPPKAPDPHL